jgi:hypothetical protein
MNPYESWFTASGDDTDSKPRGSLRREVFVLVLAAVSFFVLGSLGGALVAHSCVAGEIFIGETGMILMYWLEWSGKIVGRFCGDYLSGVVIGRYLHRINPRYVVFLFLLFPIAVVTINRGFLDADDGLWRQSVGIAGCVIQLTVQILMMLLVLSFGVWFGRWSLRGAQRKGSTRDGRRAEPSA